MKRTVARIIRNWFGYTRRERRASLTILIIIILVALSRYAVPSADMDLEILPVEPEGEQVPVSVSPASGRPGGAYTVPRSSGTVQSNVELNSCDSTMLDRLPGIGPVLSARIIKYRNLLGGFARVDQLREVYGLPAETYELIRNLVYTDTLKLRKVKINEADYSALIRIPYIERHEVSSIIKFRQLGGRIGTPEDIIANKLIAADKFPKLRSYIEY